MNFYKKNLWEFLEIRKKYWFFRLVVFFLFGSLPVLTQGSAVALLFIQFLK